MQLSGNDFFEALASGDINTFEMCFKSYYAQLCNYAFSFVRNADESEEVVQNCFVAIWEKRQSLQISGSVKSYLFAMVRNSCLNRLKHEKIKQKYVVAFQHAPDAHEAVADTITSEELEQKISAAIELLPEQCRLVFKLSRFEELKYQEIADQLEISIKTVENHMGKALRIMREELKEYLPAIILMLALSLFMVHNGIN